MVIDLSSKVGKFGRTTQGGCDHRAVLDKSSWEKMWLQGGRKSADWSE